MTVPRMDSGPRSHSHLVRARGAGWPLFLAGSRHLSLVTDVFLLSLGPPCHCLGTSHLPSQWIWAQFWLTVWFCDWSQELGSARG